MPTVQFHYAVALTTGSRLREFAQPFVPPTLDLVSDPLEYRVALPLDGSIVTIWDSAAGGANPTSFRLLILHSDQLVDLEFTASGTAVADNISTCSLAAGDIPFFLGSDRAYAAAGSLAGTLGRFTKIRARNTSTDAIAYVDVVIGA